MSQLNNEILSNRSMEQHLATVRNRLSSRGLSAIELREEAHRVQGTIYEQGLSRSKQNQLMQEANMIRQMASESEGTASLSDQAQQLRANGNYEAAEHMEVTQKRKIAKEKVDAIQQKINETDYKSEMFKNLDLESLKTAQANLDAIDPLPSKTRGDRRNQLFKEATALDREAADILGTAEIGRKEKAAAVQEKADAVRSEANGIQANNYGARDAHLDQQRGENV